MQESHTMNEPNKATGDVNRRNFLKTTSTAVGGAVLGALSVERAAFAAADDTIKVALVGCGGRGSGAAAQALGTKGSVKLVAMADAFKERLENSYREISSRHKDRVD